MRAPILAVILASVPALAAADEIPPAAAPAPVVAAAPAYAAPAPEAVIAQQPVPVSARGEDPNIDRVFLMPSAETQPAGTVSFNDYELLFLGVTYGVTDHFQITGQALAPIVKDMPIILNGSGKYAIISEGRLHLALQGGLTYLELNDDFFFEDNSGGSTSVLIVSGGAIASACLDDDCHSLATVSLTAGKGIAEGNDTSNLGFIYSGGITAKVAKHAKLLLEVTSAGSHDSEGFNAGDGALVSYGVRFYNSSIAGDIGFVKPVGGDGNDDLLLGAPFINFTYRQ